MPTVTRTTTTVTRTTTLVPTYREGPARGWLKTLGFLLLAIAILGLVPTVRDLGHDVGFHLEGGESVVHWVLAIGTLVAAYAVRSPFAISILAIAMGAVYLLVAAVGVLTPELGAWHVGVADNVLHLLLGVTTLLVGIVSLNRERDAGRRRVPVAGAV